LDRLKRVDKLVVYHRLSSGDGDIHMGMDRANGDHDVSCLQNEQQNEDA
jgi:hypothetical protein